MSLVWILVALGSALGMVYATVRVALRRLPPMELPAGEALPRTPVQRLARWCLLSILLLTLLDAATVLHFGPEEVSEVTAVRLGVTVLLIAALALYAYYAGRVGAWSARDDGTLDERDRAILAAAPAGQAPAIIITLAVWMIGLVEAHGGGPSIPLVYLYLIFWSCLMVGVLSLLAGVLIGYRRR